MPASPIVSLAILKVNWDELRRDYLENFVPFVGECLRVSETDVVSDVQVQSQMRDLFGLRLPQATVGAIIRRAAKRDYVRKHDRVFYRNLEKLEASNFRAVQDRVVERHGELIGGLSEFCAAEFDISWTQDQADAALQDYIQAHQTSILTGSQDSVLDGPRPPLRTSRYLVASFVNHLRQTDSPKLSYLEEVVIGSMVATALFLPDPTRLPSRFHNTEVYLDSRLILYALGYAGDARRDAARELLNLLKEAVARLRCFKHTVDEMHGILDATAHRVRTRAAFGEAAQHFIDIRAQPSDILALSAGLEHDLERLRIEVVDTPPYDEHAHVIDESGLKTALADEVYYGTEEALDRDVASISAIARFRRGEPFYRIEDCRAIFLTTNTPLARISRNLFRAESPSSQIAPCITDYILTTLLWLSRPTAAPNLPMKRIIADCYAAMQPSELLIRKYVEQIDDLESKGEVTEDDYYILRHSMEARASLMQFTLGDDAQLTQGTVSEILDAARARIQGSLKMQYDALSAREERRERTRRALAARIASVVSKTLKLSVGILLVVAGLLAFPWGLPSLDDQPVRYLVSLAAGGLLIATLVNLIWGTTLVGVAVRLELKLARQLDVWLARLGGDATPLSPGSTLDEHGGEPDGGDHHDAGSE